jgi:hypothetical protein
MFKIASFSIFLLLFFFKSIYSDDVYEGDKNIKVGFGVGIALRNDLKITTDYLIGSWAPYSVNVEFYIPVIFKSSSRFEPEFKITYISTENESVKINSTMLRIGIGAFPFIIKHEMFCFEPGIRMGYNMTIQRVVNNSDYYVTVPNQNFYNPYAGLAISTEIFFLKKVSLATELQVPVTFIGGHNFIISTEGTLGLRVYL